MKRITLGISCGDPNGVGIEVALRAFADERLFDYFAPVLFASAELVDVHREANDLLGVPIVPVPSKYRPAAVAPSETGEAHQTGEVASEVGAPAPVAEHDGEAAAAVEDAPPVAAEDEAGYGDFDDNAVRVVTCWEHEPPVEFGRVSAEGGAVAKTSLEHAVAALHAGHVDVLVTAPIHKSAMQQASFGYPGHTEYLEREFGDGKSLMLMVGDDGLRVAVATNHVPLRSVATSISPTILQNKIALLDRSLRRDFGINRPTIAVLGLNPHAGDEGAIGTEEQTTIRPAVEAMKARGVDVMGPYPADGFFGSARWRSFDGVLAMYHDQGLVPFKTLAFGGGVNYTAGLRAVRTSPDHGTALDIAGKGQADAASFVEAAFVARDVYLQRAAFDADHADPIQVRAFDRKRRGGKGGERGGRNRRDDRPGGRQGSKGRGGRGKSGR